MPDLYVTEFLYFDTDFQDDYTSETWYTDVMDAYRESIEEY